jgi:hypothetical protein
LTPVAGQVTAARKLALGLDPRVAAGMPEAVVKEKRPVGRSPEGEGRSYTGAFLKPVLGRRGVERKRRTEAAE